MGKQMQQPIRQSIYRNHPQAYFLIGPVMHKATNRNWEDILEPIQIEGPERLSRAVAEQVRNADRDRALATGQNPNTVSSRYGPQHKFAFFGYREVAAEVAPTTFVCRRCGHVTSLKDKIEGNRLTKNDLMCPNCHLALNQVVHVFGHPACGRIEEILPLFQNCSQCGQAYRLILDNSAFSRSRWICPNGHERDLAMSCRDCEAGGMSPAETRMSAYAAGAAVKPLSFTKVDIDASANWENVARQRLELSGDALSEAILGRYRNGDPFTLKAMEALLTNESTRLQVQQEFLAQYPEYAALAGDIERAIGGTPSYDTQMALAEYGGVDAQAKRLSRSPLNSYFRKQIVSRYHITPRYIPALPLMEMVYGYQVGSSNSRARVRTFDRGWDSVVLCHRTTTEAALFDLDPAELAKWVGRKLNRELDKLELQRMLMRPESNHVAYGYVDTLLHTIAHLMIRQSELYTGLSRESLSELIFPSAMAFAIYAADGSELGALRSAFASFRLRDWLGQCYSASRTCALDPSCLRCRITTSAACHSCLHIAERSCNGYWNERLDRRVVSSVEESDGFWD